MNLIKIKIITNGFFKLKNISKDEFIYTRQGEFLLDNNMIVDITKKFVLLDDENNPIQITETVTKITVDKDFKKIILQDSSNNTEFTIGIWIFRNPMGLIDTTICYDDKEIIRFITSDSSGDSSENSSSSIISIGESNDMSIDTERIGFNWKKMKIKIQSNNVFLKVTNPVTIEVFYTRICDIYINKDGKLCDIGGYLFELSGDFTSDIGTSEISIDYNGVISFKDFTSNETITTKKIKLYKFNNQLGLTDVSKVLKGEILAGSISNNNTDKLYFPTTIKKTEEIDQILFEETTISGTATLTDFPNFIKEKINDKKDPCERFGVNYYQLKFRPLNEYLFRYKFIKSNETLTCYSSDGDLYLILDNNNKPKLVNILGMELDISDDNLSKLSTKLGTKFCNQDLITINEFAEVIMTDEVLFKLPMSKIRQEMTVQNSDNLELLEYTVLNEPIQSGNQHKIVLDLYNMSYSGPKSSPNYEQSSINLTIASDINQIKKVRLYFDTQVWQTLESQDSNIKVITNSQEIDTNEELIYTNKLENGISKIKSLLGI